MQRYEMLRNNLYSADLLYGKIELKPTHRFSCFFIVEHTFDVEFIKDQAIQLLLVGCQEFVDTLNERLSERPFVPHDFYLIYDDEGIYRNVLRLLAEK